MDGSGNISPSSLDEFNITDTAPPTITSFTIPATGTSYSVDITSMTATDNLGVVSGYMITEVNVAPIPSDIGWSASPVSSYGVTNGGSGTYTLYAWAKDPSGNVSSSASASIDLTIA